mmetsp:Transcript_84697/g.117698  ORF Transcript_84697/g.117698 Transcript_84697/m.117698 type:complete len:83 (+) Transcript_84697:241-489(+)
MSTALAQASSMEGRGVFPHSTVLPKQDTRHPSRFAWHIIKKHVTTAATSVAVMIVTIMYALVSDVLEQDPWQLLLFGPKHFS